MSEAIINSVLIGLEAFRLDPLYAGIDGRGQTVAIVDTGFDLNHPAFGLDSDNNGIADRIVFSYDFSGNNDGDAGYGGLRNQDGDLINTHGTHVAAIVGSQDEAHLGIAPGCNLALLKSFSDNATATENDTGEALNWLAGNQSNFTNLVAVNMSFGSNDPNGNDVIYDHISNGINTPAFRALSAQGVALIAAAGNAGSTHGVGYPAADPFVIGVGATEGNRFASYSNRTSTAGLIDITAPGTALAAIPDDTYGYMAGTSMAAPIISGVAALMGQLSCEITHQSTYKLSPALFLDLMQLSADQFYDLQTNSFFPRINVERLADRLVEHFRVFGDGVGGFYGWRGDDTVFGSSSSDLIRGNDGSDILYANEGNDSLFGDMGDDVLIGGSGSDSIDGGLGRDIADYSESTSSIVANITERYSFSGAVYDGSTDPDQLVRIEVVRGSQLADQIKWSEAYGLGGNDTLEGLADNNDTLDGGDGADTMRGLSGSDRYYVDNMDDVVIEGDSEGFDTVYTSVSYTLPAFQFIEMLLCLDSSSLDNISLTGNEFDNFLWGNAGNNIISGMGGSDSMLGLEGDDFYVVTDLGDIVGEKDNAGNDTVYASVDYILPDNVENLIMNSSSPGFSAFGNRGTNQITASYGDDVIDGKGGADSLYGLLGSDTYYVDNVGDRVFEVTGEGTDTVYASVSYALQAGQSVETLRSASAADTITLALTGNEFGQRLLGNAGYNRLDGGGGADNLYGFGGNDVYVVDSTGDRVFEVTGQGTDTVYASVSYVLQAGQSVETLRTSSVSGTTTQALTGNDLGQTLFGNAGYNRLDGGGGADKLYGYGGNDVYLVDNEGDLVFEVAGEGTDTVYASLSYALGAGQSVETLRSASPTSTAAQSLTGNEFSQRLLGNAGANLIDGGGGIDTLYGYGGADTFRFSSAFSRSNIDHIADFSAIEDTIQLDRSIFTKLDIGHLNIDAYKDISASGAVIDADDRILYDHDTGALFYDSNGSGAGGRYQFAVLDNRPATLIAADFFVVA